MPKIQVDGENVTFSMEIEQSGVRLVIRCDAGGNVWASIAVTPQTPHER